MTARQLLCNARLNADPKRCVSLAELERWLQKLADVGILKRVGDEWQPTPAGALWLNGCFPVDGDEVAV